MHHLSPEPVAHLSQHQLLPILLKTASAPDVHSEVKFGYMISGVGCLPSGKIMLTVDEPQVRLIVPAWNSIPIGMSVLLYACPVVLAWLAR